jgi:hypothetical protein
MSLWGRAGMSAATYEPIGRYKWLHMRSVATRGLQRTLDAQPV